MMTKRLLARGLTAAAIGILAATPTSLAQEDHDEHVFTVGAITIDHPWAQAAGSGSDTLVFFETRNEGEPDTLLSASAEIAGAVEIVGLTLIGDEIQMVPIGPIEIPAGEFELDPGGLALALRGLTMELTEGAEFELTLVFELAGETEIHVSVEAEDAMIHGHAH